MVEIEETTRIRVWDLPVRLFHWLLVLLVLILFITGKLGGNWLAWHQRAGFSVLGLITFRIIWGFVGSHHARFANFPRGSAVTSAYLRGIMRKDSRQFEGHNPLGVLSVVMMLGALLLQAVLGLFANDDLMLEGPYARLISKAASDQVTSLHKLNADLILILIGIHLVAIAFSWFYKRQNLVMPMFTGDKLGSATAAENLRRHPRPIWLAWLTGACVAIATYALMNS